MAPLSTLLAAAQLASLVAGQTAVTVTTGTKYQLIDGFGFSQAFGRAKQFQNAAAGLQKQALDYLFSTTTGAGFSILRNRIGSGGSGDSILPTSPGSPSSTPAYVWDGDDSGQVWLTKQAVSYGVKTIYADAWSAPGFMKTSGSESTPGYLCGTPGHTCSTGDWRQAYANMLVKYVQYYASEGVTISHLGFLNEPDWEVSYSQMQISSNATEAIDFIRVLAPTVKAAGLSTKLACCDAVGWKTTTTNYIPALVAANSTAYLDVITSHGYTSDISTPATGTSKRKWTSENGPSGLAFTTTWYSTGAANEGFTWAQKLAVAMVNAELSAYIFWQGFQVGNLASGMHVVDTFDNVTATPSGIFWAFAMWSRHIRPGAYRVAAQGSPASVITGAFVNADGSVVVVLTNGGTATQAVQLGFADFVPASAAAWVTSSSATFASTGAAMSGGKVTVSVPARGVVTVKLTGSTSGGGGSTTTTTTKTLTTKVSTTLTTSTAASSTTSSSCTAAHYGQCGGIGFKGCTTCASPYTCKYANDYYSQCL